MVFSNPIAFFALILLMVIVAIILINKTKIIVKLPMIIAFLCFIVGLSKPELGHYEITRSSELSSIVIMIDTSHSMSATDILPSRIGFSVELAKKLISSIPNIQVAIFPFASDGFFQLPFTSDIDAANDVLNSLDTFTHSDQGTDISTSLKSLYINLVKIGKKSQNRLWYKPDIILFSDGESHEPLKEDILSLYRSKNIVIHTVSIGTSEGAIINVANNIGAIRTRVNKSVLEKISIFTGGHSFKPSLSEFDKIETLISKSLNTGRMVAQFKTEKELFPFFFLISFLLFLVDLLLGKWNYVLRIIFIFIIPMNVMASSEPTKKSDIDYYNMAITSLKNGDLSSAAMYFQHSAFLSENAVLKKKAFYNLGNTLVKLGDFDTAIEIYQLAYDIITKNKTFYEDTNKLISENIVLAMRLYKKAIEQAKKNGKKDGDVTDSLRREKYRAEIYSSEEKEKLFKIIQSEELEIYRSMKTKKNYSGKPW